MSLQNQVKQNKNLFRDLPYFGQNITLCRGQFNDLIQLNDLPNKKYLERLPSLQDIDLFTLNLDEKSILIRKSIKTKNKLFNEGNKGLYKFYRNKILFLTRLRKKIYFHSYFEDNINNPKNVGWH